MCRVIRRLTITVVVLGAGWSLAACGSGGHTTTAPVTRATAATSVTPGAARASGATAKPPTRLQALAFARAVNLTAADVPGFKTSSKKEHETPAEKRLEGELMRCAGAPSSKGQLVQMNSKEFGREDQGAVQSLYSGVSVEQTAAVAAEELAAVRSARGRGCLSHYVDRLFKSQRYRGASVSPVSISSGSPSAPGTTGTFAWRIKIAITARGIRIPFLMDFAGFVYGPAEVTLFSFGLPQPLPAAMEERLFALLVERAKTHRL
jgi:hypothetical protein